MSDQHAFTGDSRGAAVREALRGRASAIRTAIAPAADDAPARVVEHKRRALLTRLRRSQDMLQKRLAARLREEPRPATVASACRLVRRALGPDKPPERTVWLPAPRGRFPFRHRGLGR
jgi:hypothetical protein